jgi:hypothetical protein
MSAILMEAIADQFPATDKDFPEVSIIMPRLNEADTLAACSGYQSIVFAILTKPFAISEGLLPEDPRMNRFFELVNLERGLIFSSIALFIGMGLLMAAVHYWRQAGFGYLDYAPTMRLVVPGATPTAIGFQTILSSFFASILGMRRR